MPLSFTVHCFPLQMEKTASTSPVYQVCVIHHKYCFPPHHHHKYCLHLPFRKQKNPTVPPIPRSSWDPAEYNIPPLVFCIVTFVLTFREEMGVWAACRNSARAVVPAEFLWAVWKQQEPPEPLPVCLPGAGSSPALRLPAQGGCRGAPLALLLFLFPPSFLTLSAQTGAGRCELTLPLLWARRSGASPCAGAVWAWLSAQANTPAQGPGQREPLSVCTEPSTALESSSARQLFPKIWHKSKGLLIPGKILLPFFLNMDTGTKARDY